MCGHVIMQQAHQPSREPLPAILHTGSVGCCIPQAASQQTASIQLQISEIACSGIDDRFLHALLAAAQCCMLLNTVHMHLPHKCCSIGTTTYPIPPEACALKYACQACMMKALWHGASTTKVHSRGTKRECIPARPSGHLPEASTAVARLFGLGSSH